MESLDDMTIGELCGRIRGEQFRCAWRFFVPQYSSGNRQRIIEVQLLLVLGIFTSSRSIFFGNVGAFTYVDTALRPVPASDVC